MCVTKQGIQLLSDTIPLGIQNGGVINLALALVVEVTAMVDELVVVEGGVEIIAVVMVMCRLLPLQLCHGLLEIPPTFRG